MLLNIHHTFTWCQIFKFANTMIFYEWLYVLVQTECHNKIEMCTIKFTDFIWDKNRFIIIGIFLLSWTCENRAFDMEDYCGKKLSMILTSTYQLELELSDKHIYDREWSRTKLRTCEITIEAWYKPYRKLMFYCDDFDLDCDDGHLEFFVGQNSKTRVTGLKNNICGDNKPQGVFTVNARYFRIRYIPRKSQSNSDIFSIIITSYSDNECPSYAYKCDNSRCINKDIACNEYDSCGDGSGCNKDVIEYSVIIGAIIGGLLVLVFIVSVIVCCVCCKRKTVKTQGAVQYKQSSFPTAIASTTSGQHQGYRQPVYGVSHGGHYTNKEAPYPIASTSILPTAPVAPDYRATYQEPAPVLSYSQQSMSPPPYSELFAQSDH